MPSLPRPTCFLPAEIAPPEALAADVRYFAENPLQIRLLDAVPNFYLILNEQRQVVYANKAVREALAPPNAGTLSGQRPGQVLGCVHADEEKGGCGTAAPCRYCGAAKAIQASLQGRGATEECSISLKNGEALDLRVWSTPLELGDRRYSIVAFNDISHEQRRRVLERIFFHDVLNTAGSLQGLLEIMKEAKGDEYVGLLDIVQHTAEDLVAEINAQQLLLVAESGDLSVRPELLMADRLLKEILESYRSHKVARGPRIALASDVHRFVFKSDPALLKRVLGNMLKNALEAAGPGDVVTMGARLEDRRVQLWVHNPTYMPRKVQLQVFKRSFSTKGTGRGLGTYGMKLLVEQYLGGRVSFRTAAETGTTFRVHLASAA